MVHDFYFPYVGLENHAAGTSPRHKIGVWIDGQLSWLDDDQWEIHLTYPHDALIGHTTARNDNLGVLLEFDDTVDAQMSAFIRTIHVVNLRNEKREIRLFTHQAFAIGDSRSNTDTAQYLPDSDAILHYRGRRAFIISGTSDGKPFDQYTVGLYGIEGREGSHRDADDGELSFCNVEHGRVDSVLRFALEIGGHSSSRVQYWIAAGTSTREALYVHRQMQTDGVPSRLEQTSHWWHKWLEPALNAAEKVTPSHRKEFLRSVMIIKSQIDKRGAVMASTDTTMLNQWRDAYAYSWPRDGAYVLWPLIRMGYVDEPRRFFEFCKRGLHPNGYLMHKYRADGALGSSWHPYVHADGKVAAPIQEDETALVLFVFAQFYRMHPSARLLSEFYESMIMPMANFMAGHIDELTGLPSPTYDLWEEVYETTTYSTSLTYAALLAAAELAEAAEDADNAVRWRSAADDILAAAQRHLFNHDRQSFYKGLLVHEDKIEYDATIDNSSTFGAFMYGLFPADSDEMQAAIKTQAERFGLNDGAIGLPRYEDDNYCRADDSITGNYWLIATLWRAQYYIETGKHDEAMKILDWVKGHALSTGVMPEQISPIDNSPISVAPLTWSHAEYVATLLDTIAEKK